jgi:signal transduction histidine kinase
MPAAAAVGARAGSFRLVRFFGLIGFLVTIVASGALITHHSAHDAASLMKLAEDQNTTLARAFANEIWPRHGAYLQSVGSTTGDALRARSETRTLDAEIRSLVKGLPVHKVKIYNRAGLTIYSSDAAQIGESKSENPGFLRAVIGRQPVSQTSFRGEFAAFSGKVADVDLAETYVPIVLPSGTVGAVFELYTDITRHVVEMRHDNFIESAIILATMLAVFAGMLAVIYRADIILRRQHLKLAQAHAELTEAHAMTASLNASLRDKIGQLERSNQDLKDFAHVAAHDLQEPLRKIETFGQRLMTRHAERLPDDGRMFVERMNDAAGRMRRLITDLLSYARLNKEGPGFTPVDLSVIVKEALQDLHVRLEETGADVHVSRLATIDANPSQMRQLVQNLVANALKFTRPGVKPVIRITGEIRREGSGKAVLHLSVADNGIGFDNASADKLFKLFQRLHGRSEYEGTGVGLATCRRIAENHRGTIVACGVAGEGATFTVTLPMAQPRELAMAA